MNKINIKLLAISLLLVIGALLHSSVVLASDGGDKKNPLDVYSQVDIALASDPGQTCTTIATAIFAGLEAATVKCAKSVGSTSPLYGAGVFVSGTLLTGTLWYSTYLYCVGQKKERGLSD